MTRSETAANTIARAAARETSVLGQTSRGMKRGEDLNRYVLAGRSQNVFSLGKTYVYIVSVHDAPISLENFQAMKSDIRVTHGFYTLRYLPMASKERKPKFPYVIGQDLVRLRVTVSGPQHWDAMCDRIPELAWIKRNSTLTNDMFAIAKQHPGLALRFGINFSKYCSTITRKAEELGIDIDHKPLVVWQWGRSNLPQVDGTNIPQKTKADYIKEIEETQAHITREEDL